MVEDGPGDSRPEVVLPSGLDSGDIVLFNRRCLSMKPAGAALCSFAKVFSNSQWDHVGIVVKHPETGELLFLEADLGGVKLRSLKERVRRSRSNEIAVRTLSVVRTDAMRSKLYSFAQEMLGTPYDLGTSQLFSSIIDPLAKQEREKLHALLINKRAQISEIDHALDAAVLTAFQRRSLQSERKRVEANMKTIQARLIDVLKDRESDPFESKDDLSRVFCSELVAAAYQRMELLETYPPAAGYNPKDFSSEQQNPPGIHLLKGARLSGEKYLRTLQSKANRWRGLVGGAGTNKQVSQFRSVTESGQPSREARMLIKEALRRTPLSSMIPDEYKKSHFVSSFQAQIVEPGELIFEQGAYGDSFYVVESGLCERFMSKDHHDPILTSTLGPRNSFGMTAFLFNCPRTATVRAKEKSLLWKIDRATFEVFRDSSGDVKALLSEADQRRLRGILCEHFLFKRLDRLGARELNAFFAVKFRAGEQVFKQGDAGDNFYIIKSGEFERHIQHPRPGRRSGNGENSGRGTSPDGSGGTFGTGWADDEFSTLAKTLGPGQSFGELSLMYNAPRASTVRARTDAEVWAISGESFHRLHLGGGAQYLRTIFREYASEVRDGEPYMTVKDLLKFAKADLFPKQDRERLSSLLVSLVTCNRELDNGGTWRNRGLAPDHTEDEKNEQGILIDFWEFVRFDIMLNQPAAELDFAFRLADRNNSGFIDLEELQSLLHDYTDEDPVARHVLSGDSRILQRVFGRDGSRVLNGKEFRELANDVLPPVFRSDVKRLSDHILNEIEATSEQDNFDAVTQTSIIDSDSSVYRPGSLISSFSNSTLSAMPFLRGVEPSHLFAVVLSSAISRTTVAPLERLKILMQTQPFESPRYPGLISGLRTMIREEKSIVRSFFRGNGANIIRIVPQAAVQVIALEQLRRHALPKLKGEVSAKARARPSPLDTVVVAGFSGMIAATVTYPLDFIRGRLAVQRHGFEAYRGVLDGIKQTVKREGLSCVYRGLTPTLLGVFPYFGLSFMVYEILRPILPRRNDTSGRPTYGSAILCSAIASATGQLFAYPFDTCRRKMQLAGFGDSAYRTARENGTFSGVVRNTIRHEGVRGFFRGAIPNLAKVAPFSFASFFAYEYARGYYRDFADVSTQPAPEKLR